MILIIKGQTYIISERKNQGNKPTLFMLKLTGKARQYVSSLYPTDILNVYRFDYRGQQYTLDIEQKTINLITPVS